MFLPESPARVFFLGTRLLLLQYTVVVGQGVTVQSARRAIEEVVERGARVAWNVGVVVYPAYLPAESSGGEPGSPAQVESEQQSEHVSLLVGLFLERVLA